MGKSKVANKTLNVQQNVSIKQSNRKLKKNEKTTDITPSAAKNTKSEPMINNFVDENDFYDENSSVNDEDDDYSDESYEFDEAETAQEAFEAKYYHNRRTSSSNNKSSYNNKISLKKVNTLLANQNIMVVDKNQLSETINNNGLLSARVPTTPHPTPIQLDGQKSANSTTNPQQQQQFSNDIDLTVLCSNTSICSNLSNKSEELSKIEVNDKEPTNNNNNMASPTKINNTNQNNYENNNNTNNKKGRKLSKKNENSKSSQIVTEDTNGYIKSKKSKNRRRSDVSSTKSNSVNNSNDHLNQSSTTIQTNDTTTSVLAQNQMNQISGPNSARGSVQISVDNKKQIHIICGPKNTPIKISDNKNLAVIVNPDSIQESDIQELLISPTKSRSKNNKPSIPVISSSPYTRNHNRNNNKNKNNNNMNGGDNKKPLSPQKLSADVNELMLSPTKSGKNKFNNNSIIAESPLFVGSYPPLINTKNYKYNGSKNQQQLNQDEINYKYNLLDEYNMKKSASPVSATESKNRFLKDESENRPQSSQLNKKERKALKKLQKNKKFNDEFDALNNTRKTYIVNDGDNEIYNSIFNGQCDTESESENVLGKKNKKMNRKQQQQQPTIDEYEELESPTKGKKNNKKNQKKQQEQQPEEEMDDISKKQNKKNTKQNKKNRNTTEDNDDDNVNHRKHTKKSKHQELEFNIEDANDDIFGISGKPSSMKNKKSKNAVRK
ncbi:hypothetical protein BCR32DRAFT_288922 [Anaeromyces robustus]|uniref:Uncharacterized protein n=1 Tax=Anaeromyces robustus TaxID=1754192 RepID=A0A1Y1XR70_9FUNG|nr:hypothetical protein BCR32DRAFT_288922 [Anaeromyces robustus]|eukprot:ORX87986.1 hypothetical protein BCR32DRAFT_288922 [Anaeromyces robustus]